MFDETFLCITDQLFGWLGGRWSAVASWHCGGSVYGPRRLGRGSEVLDGETPQVLCAGESSVLVGGIILFVIGKVYDGFYGESAGAWFAAVLRGKEGSFGDHNG
jgi:hypothetical protein